jgi:hypothetical protein
MLSNIQKSAIDNLLIEEEYRRITAEPVQGEQSCAVQSDMKQWALKEGHWPQMDYVHMIASHAVARGWTQENFNEMEIIEPFWDWVEDRV